MEMLRRAVRKELLNRALAAVLAIIVCGGALNWGHAGGDDQDCDSTPVVHDHNAHRFTSAPSHSTPPADHCYICHSLRLLHTSLLACGARAVVAAGSAQFRQVEQLAVINPSGVVLSSRAPPAASL
jgi:hypothetical protein